jgi:hypothetical protein
MEINYVIVALVVLVVLGLAIYVIKRNKKDLNKFEKEIIDSELKPDKHKEHKP